MVCKLMPNPTLATLDFEASSLDETSHPIEVAFVLGPTGGVTGRFSTLIRPRAHWKGPKAWSEASQAVHGIAAAELDDGMDADSVCNVLNAALADLNVAVDGGSFDAFWLERLYDGRPCTFELDHLSGVDPAEFNERKRGAGAIHRALPDAEWLWRTLQHLSGHAPAE